MFYYAQLDKDNVCIAFSCLSGEVNADNMIQVEADTNCLGKKYVDGEWVEIPRPEIPEPTYTAPKSNDEIYENQMVIIEALAEIAASKESE